MNKLKEAISAIKSGGIVIFPTDTVYGLGCRIDNHESVRKLFSIKKRPRIQAVPILVDSIKMAQMYLVFPLHSNVRHLMEKYWPGGVTFVYPCRIDKVYSLVRGGGSEVAVRMPDHDIPLQLISAVGVPIVGTSANFHQKEPPTTYEKIDQQMKTLADYAVEGECYLKKSSTIVNCIKHPPEIIRSGAVEIDEIW